MALCVEDMPALGDRLIAVEARAAQGLPPTPREVVRCLHDLDEQVAHLQARIEALEARSWPARWSRAVALLHQWGKRLWLSSNG
jgi:hypothetical protein